MSTKQTAETENSSDGACVLRVLTFNVTNYILVHLDKVCLANKQCWLSMRTLQHKYISLILVNI